MARSATFSVIEASEHSTAHNSRKDKPKYLIGAESGEENIYNLRYSDSDFIELSKAKYKEITGQKMQQKQVDALIKETVLSLEDHHTEDDVRQVFNELHNKYGGHYITELSIHRDEGYFEDKNGITYYPTTDILEKEDGWYIVPLEKSITMNANYKPKYEEFSQKVDINKFKKIYNYHAHVKFSMFDPESGKTGRMKHFELNDRIKTAAKVLNLDYDPEQTTKTRVPVAEIKAQHKAARNEKVIAFLNNQELKEELTTVSEIAKQADLKQEISTLREQLKAQSATRADYAALEQLNRDLKAELKANKLTIDDLRSIIDQHKKQEFEIVNLKSEIQELRKENNIYKRVFDEFKKITKLEKIKDIFEAVKAKFSVQKAQSDELVKETEKNDFRANSDDLNDTNTEPVITKQRRQR